MGGAWASPYGQAPCGAHIGPMSAYHFTIIRYYMFSSNFFMKKNCP